MFTSSLRFSGFLFLLVLLFSGCDNPNSRNKQTTASDLIDFYRVEINTNNGSAHSTNGFKFRVPADWKVYSDTTALDEDGDVTTTVHLVTEDLWDESGRMEITAGTYELDEEYVVNDALDACKEEDEKAKIVFDSTAMFGGIPCRKVVVQYRFLFLNYLSTVYLFSEDGKSYYINLEYAIEDESKYVKPFALINQTFETTPIERLEVEAF